MSTIDFVVRDSAGNIRRGSVGDDSASSSIIVSSGQDVSLNLDQTQVLSYRREGQALQVALIDGSIITIEGFFSSEGIAENQLFISANGQLAEVDLATDGIGVYHAQYVSADNFGKWSPDDDLYFVRGSEVQLADAYDAVAAPADDEVGMLAVPLLGGLGGVGTAVGVGGAVIGGGAIIGGIGGGGGGGGGSDPAPVVTFTKGTEGAGDFVNEADHADGVELGGNGDVGAAVTVTVGGVTRETIVKEDGTWEVIFGSNEVLPGEYETEVLVTITNENGTGSAVDMLIVDMVAGLGFDASTVEGNGSSTPKRRLTGLR